MKKFFLVTAILLAVLIEPEQPRSALLEAAEDCESARRQLAELVAKPDLTHENQVRDALGVDIINSCDSPGGKHICFQCLDSKGNLRTLQLFHDLSSRKFQFLGFGCKCRE